MTERDSLTDWFHSFADRPLYELVTLASPENIDLLSLYVLRSTPGYSLPEALGPSEFAEAVIAFRQNECAWNRATMAALIKADDLFKAGSITEAAESLQVFASSCPWLLFKEAALNQATLYR